MDEKLIGSKKWIFSKFDPPFAMGGTKLRHMRASKCLIGKFIEKILDMFLIKEKSYMMCQCAPSS